MKTLILMFAVLPLSFYALAKDGQHGQISEYAGQQARSIKSLSSEDIAELRRGGGWGLARAAELNGVPGPAHLLELKDEIPLSDSQITRISSLYEDMKTRAIRQGEELISLERELERHFQESTITDDILRSSLDNISEARTNLRYIHLATHLETPDILSDAQIRKYNELRGYANADPCASVPEGHDASMWRKHNGCD